MKRLILLAATVVSPAMSYAAAPVIHVGAMYEYAEPGKSTLLKRVRNTGDATAFVRVDVHEVRYDADNNPYEVEVDTSQASIGGTTAGLMASPSRMIVPASGQQATRLLYQGDRQRERYYRVRFVPVMPKAGEFALNEAESATYSEQLSVGVNVMTGYGVFVIVRPDNASYDVRTEEQADKFVLRNVGNTTVVLDDVRECTGSGKAAQCSEPRKLHLLPQRTQEFARRADTQHRFELVEGDARKPIQLNL